MQAFGNLQAAKCTGADVDKLIVEFEKAAAEVEQNKSRAVRLRVAESDLLIAAGMSRDLMDLALKGSKTQLVAVFGGTCERFWRYQNVIDQVGALSDMLGRDQRWMHINERLRMIKMVLEEMGQAPDTPNEQELTTAELELAHLEGLAVITVQQVIQRVLAAGLANPDTSDELSEGLEQPFSSCSSTSVQPRRVSFRKAVSFNEVAAHEERSQLILWWTKEELKRFKLQPRRRGNDELSDDDWLASIIAAS